MSYYDVFLSRINHLGDTTAKRIREGGIRSFEKWKAESPHTVLNLSVERGLFFDGIILTSKDRQYEKIMFLNVSNNIPLLVGDIMNWTLDDGTIEKWIIAQEEKKVNGTYRTFWIIRCNYLLRWIDDLGHLQQSWAYVVSSVDSKIKGNYRTWNSLITPQPNKYAEILMPRYPISRSTNFIVEDESWNVIEYDHTSVPGTIYLSLTEGKINMIYDDLINNIADTDKMANYQLSIPEQTQTFVVGQEIIPSFTLTKNGIPYNASINLLPQDNQIVKLVDGKLKAVAEGITTLVVQLQEYPQIQQTLTIEVSNTKDIFSAYIEGPAFLRLNRNGTYILKGTSDMKNKIINFAINNSELAEIEESNNDSCVIHANDKNILGEFILTATCDGHDYTKVITIKPLW